jgi:carboxymethylenebutenolidase
MALHGYLVEEVALDRAAGLLTRREAMRRLGLLGVSAVSAAALLAACGDDDDAGDGDADAVPTVAGSADAGVATTAPTPATNPSAAPISADGSSPVETSAAPTSAAATEATEATPAAEEIRFAGPDGELIGVLATAESPRGAVLVIHENRGLTEHIRSIPPRLAADGYTALAIDLLSAEGGTASLPSEGDATAALGAAPEERLIADLRAGLDELHRRASDASLAAIGFCFGGGMVWRLLAAGEPRLTAAVPFYGPAPEGADFSGSPNAAVLGIYAGNDDRVNASQGSAQAALDAAGLTNELRTFDGVDHAFFNDTGPRYDADAAAEAYQAMLEWFATHLG